MIGRKKYAKFIENKPYFLDEKLEVPLDPNKPIEVADNNIATCRVLGVINSLFPIIAVVSLPGMDDVIYCIDPSDGCGISGLSTAVLYFVNGAEHASDEEDLVEEEEE